MTKALLLDPFGPSISEVSVGDFEDIQRHIGCDVFTCVRSQALKDNVLYLDDEGLINGTSRATRFVDEVYPHALAGRILILGDDGMGGDKDCTLSVAEVNSLVKHCCDILPSEAPF